MNRIAKYPIIVMFAAMCLAGCAKAPSSLSGASSKEYFDAWVQVHYPDAEPTALGAYLISETEGDGETVGDYEESPFLFVNYVISGLDGEVISNTREDMAKQLGTYEKANYYGPVVWNRSYDALFAGVEEAVYGMKVGGTKKTVIPSWLFTSLRYDNPQDYIDNVTTGENRIYDFEITGIVKDIDKWESDSLVSYLAHNFPEVSPDDTLKEGFYYVRTVEPADTAAFPADTSVYINYIGRRLDGQVFDTNIKDTAKLYGLYDSSAKYEPVEIVWGEEYEDLRMRSSADSSSDEGSQMIDGFSYALWNMRSMEKGTALFTSGLGYSSSGSGSKLPGYCPLRFDIEMVEVEEED